MAIHQQITLELVTVDEATGAITPCSALPITLPTPEITLTTAEISLDEGQRWRGKWNGEIRIAGKIHYGIASLISGSEGALKEMRLDHGYDYPLAKIPIQITKYESYSLTQPYYFEGTFEHRQRMENFFDGGFNHFRLTVHDPILGRNGDYELVFQLNVEELNPEPLDEDANSRGDNPLVKFHWFRTDYHVASKQSYFYPLLCRVKADTGLNLGQIKISTMKGNRGVVQGVNGDWYLADVEGVRPQVLIAIPDDTNGELAPDFPPPRDAAIYNNFSSTKEEIEAAIESGLAERGTSFFFKKNDDETKRNFVEGFVQGFISRGFGLYAGQQKLAHIQISVSTDGFNRNISWNWGANKYKTIPSALSDLPFCEAIGDVVFRMNLNNEDAKKEPISVYGHVLQGNWQPLGLEHMPEEHRRVLEFGYEAFEDYLKIQNTNDNLHVASRNIGRAYRESLTVLAPMSAPKVSLKQFNERKKRDFWLLLQAAKIEPTRSRSDKIIEWVMVRFFDSLTWIISKIIRRKP